MIARQHRSVRRAVRTHARLEILKRQIADWHATHKRRPDWFAPDHRGRYAYARRLLERELAEAWPRRRREDELQTAVLTEVQDAILDQLQKPEANRALERGLRSKARRLAARFSRCITRPSALARQRNG